MTKKEYMGVRKGCLVSTIRGANWIVSFSLLFWGCTSNSGRPNDSETDVDTETDTNTDHHYSDEQYSACFFQGLGNGAIDRVADFVVLSDESVVAITNEGRIVKLGPDGEEMFDKNVCSQAECSNRAVDKSGGEGFVVTGRFLGQAVFGDGEIGETHLDSPNNYSFFIALFSVDGALVWVKSAIGEADVGGTGIASFADGSCVVSGTIRTASGGQPNEVVFGQGEINEVTIVSIGSSELAESSSFIARFGENGLLEWASAESAGESGREIVAFADGSFALAGSFVGEATFGADKPGEVSLDWFPIESGTEDWVPEQYSFYLAKYNSDGSIVWVRQASTTNFAFLDVEIALLTDGSIAMSGTYGDRLGFVIDGDFAKVLEAHVEESDTGWEFRGALFLARYTSAGEIVFATTTECDNNETCGVFSTNPIAMATGRIVVSGGALGVVRFGEGSVSSSVLDLNKQPFVAVYSYEGGLTGLGTFGTILNIDDGSTPITKGHSDTFFLGGAFGGEYEIPVIDDEISAGSANTSQDPFVAHVCPDFNIPG